MLPAGLAEALQDRDTTALRQRLRGDFVSETKKCEGSEFHSPRPLVVRSYPVCPWSPNDGHPTVTLCSVCGEKLTVYQALLADHAGHVPHTLSRDFGNAIRSIAQRGWRLYEEERRTPFGQ